jgi:hypothetical protein
LFTADLIDEATAEVAAVFAGQLKAGNVKSVCLFECVRKWA